MFGYKSCHNIYLVGPKTLALHGGSVGEVEIKESAKKATEGT